MTNYEWIVSTWEMELFFIVILVVGGLLLVAVYFAVRTGARFVFGKQIRKQIRKRTPFGMLIKGDSKGYKEACRKRNLDPKHPFTRDYPYKKRNSRRQKNRKKY